MAPQFVGCCKHHESHVSVAVLLRDHPVPSTSRLAYKQKWRQFTSSRSTEAPEHGHKPAPNGSEVSLGETFDACWSRFRKNGAAWLAWSPCLDLSSPPWCDWKRKNRQPPLGQIMSCPVAFGGYTKVNFVSFCQSWRLVFGVLVDQARLTFGQWISVCNEMVGMNEKKSFGSSRHDNW